MRPGGLPQGLPPTAPQTSHLRRESSQSTHSDFSNQGIVPGQGRGGYPPQGGRGRGGYPSPNPYNQQMPYSPAPNFRPNPNQSRSAQNINAGYQQQGRFQGGYPGSPHQAARSPGLAAAQPVHQQQGQVPMYPQQYPGYPPNMGPQVNPRSSLPLHVNHPTPELNRAQISYLGPPGPFTPDLSPASGNFERLLTDRNQAQYGTPYYDPQMAQWYQVYNMNQGQTYLQAPSSPRPPQHQQQMGGQYFPGQYPNQQQPQPMSRTSSAMSATDRPGSTMGRPQAPSGTPVSSQAPAPVVRQLAPAPSLQLFKSHSERLLLSSKIPVAILSISRLRLRLQLRGALRPMQPQSCHHPHEATASQTASTNVPRVRASSPMKKSGMI